MSDGDPAPATKASAQRARRRTARSMGCCSTASMPSGCCAPTPPEEKGAILEQIAGRGKPEQDIVKELSKVRPLWRPDRFEEAHRMAMRSLEVLDRNGVRAPKMPRLGPAHTDRRLRRSTDDPLDREGVPEPAGHADPQALRTPRGELRMGQPRARHVAPGADQRRAGRAGLQGRPVRPADRAARRSPAVERRLRARRRCSTGRCTASSLCSCSPWSSRSCSPVSPGQRCYAAGVARRRIRLSTDQAIKALYETIGACGNPPKDDSYNFAIYAIVLLALAWILVPAAFWIIIAKK